MEKGLILDGKNYISASRVSKKSGYNSDYLGQLCRAGKLECRLVSRTWFVEEKSLLDHLKTGRKKSSPLLKNLEPKSQDKTDFFSKEEKNFFNSLKSGLASRPAVSNSQNLFGKFLSKNFFINSFLAIFVAISISFIVFDLGNLLVKDDSIFFENLSKATINTGENINLNNIANLSVLENIKNKFNRTTFVVKESLRNVFYNFFGKRSPNQLAKEDFKKEKNFTKLTSDERGVITIPIASDTDSSAFSKVKNYLRSSFSDEVEIIPDESGVAGVIKPVFAEPTEEEYFYVMVPSR